MRRSPFPTHPQTECAPDRRKEAWRSTQPDLDVLGFEIFENGFARELKAEAAVLPSGIGRVVGVHCAVVDANGACFQRLGDTRYRCVVAGEKIGDKAQAVSLARCTASSIRAKEATGKTGPNVSSRMTSMSGVTPVRIV